ncbi:MAG TPA: hypothetical protein VL284_17950 [Thermoanaerobaculia bacterium]|nr:hypothetical protein [Thermoanaerobaculia bacterium]
MFFVGRHQEIATIEAAIAAGRNVIVRGKFGIGRTALVREVAGRNASRCKFVFTEFSAPKLERAIAANRRRHKTILVLDDIRRMTHPKRELLRKLRASPSLLFIAILERFVSADDLMRFRVALDPAVVVTLDYLDDESSIRFFSHHARRLGLPWTETDIEMLAHAMHGYPGEMTQLIQREQRKRRAAAH